MNHYNELLSVLLCRKQQADNKLLNVSGKKHYTYIVGKGGLYYPFSVSPPPPPSQKSKMSPPFIGLSQKQKYWITLVTNLYIISALNVS